MGRGNWSHMCFYKTNDDNVYNLVLYTTAVAKRGIAIGPLPEKHGEISINAQMVPAPSKEEALEELIKRLGPGEII